MGKTLVVEYMFVSMVLHILSFDYNKEIPVQVRKINVLLAQFFSPQNNQST